MGGYVVCQQCIFHSIVWYLHSESPVFVWTRRDACVSVCWRSQIQLEAVARRSLASLVVAQLLWDSQWKAVLTAKTLQNSPKYFVSPFFKFLIFSLPSFIIYIPQRTWTNPTYLLSFPLWKWEFRDVHWPVKCESIEVISHIFSGNGSQNKTVINILVDLYGICCFSVEVTRL